MRSYAVYLCSGARAIVHADNCDGTKGQRIIFSNDDVMDYETGIIIPGQIVGIFNFNNIEGVECLGDMKND